MSRRINISKYQGNTHYNVHVIDSFGQAHHLGYYNELPHNVLSEIEFKAQEIWENEVNNYDEDMELLSNAIWGCTKLDEKLGLLKGNRDNLD